MRLQRGERPARRSDDVAMVAGWRLPGPGSILAKTLRDSWRAMAVGGVAGPSAALPVVTTVAVATFLLDTLAPVLRLPDLVSQLALTTHLGEPMVGRWDEAGIVACTAMALVGIAVGAWGVGRRDPTG